MDKSQLVRWGDLFHWPSTVQKAVFICFRKFSVIQKWAMENIQTKDQMRQSKIGNY
jgi:hypothetical protein